MPITSTDALNSLCERLSKAEYVTVDTEFLRDNTYYSKLCLIQVADDEGAHAIDPLAEDIDLTAFFDLMKNTGVLKVFHACRQDIEIFYNLMDGALPEPIFDTQIAAMVCGFGDSVGYETLVNKIARAQLDKTARYTDWSKRPLSEAQYNYALGDVTHLRKIYMKLKSELEKTGRTEWVAEETKYLQDPTLYVTEPDDAWKRLKVRTNKPRFLGLLTKVAAWREKEAIRRDLPRNRIAKDETILEVCAHPPKDETGLERVRGLPSGFSRSRAGKSLLAAIEEGMAIPDDDLPKIERTKPRPATPPMADLLKVLLKIKSQETNVAPRMIANSQELEALAAQPSADSKIMQGWRKTIFGDDAQKLIQGTLALTANNGDIEVVELMDDE
ncbi:ribonuclease D [Kordiimonas sediminis]|uniref:Ribonuclease D n=1 Tax=Kordiimonas sediminis TaxID=1735581 RepID=A0A919AX69_9PROT|nr:ribonuclease D [Kordiimonas sediminis]GHF27736.1 ribonuclease D [Kordiimonas sediminis]